MASGNRPSSSLRRTMIWSLVAWNIWFGGVIASSFGAISRSRVLALAAAVVIATAALVWALLLVRMTALARQNRAAAAEAPLLGEDLDARARSKAAGIAFAVVIAAAAVLIPVADLFALKGSLVAELTILAGVDFYMGSWLVVLRTTGGGR